ncbi:hypothetical protein [Streptomyces sp. NPDC017448]|uniref:hypothetical protein n=1 Tax=Streptomyces sp. NPDC017448 TaxID=3364996 RepID=UPI0037A3D044
MAEPVDMPKVTEKQAKPWHARGAVTFLRSARAHRLHAACVLALVLGLRRGGVLGPRRQDIDFDQRRFTPFKRVQDPLIG